MHHMHEMIATHPQVQGNTNEVLIRCLEEMLLLRADLLRLRLPRRGDGRPATAVHSAQSRLRRSMPRWHRGHTPKRQH